MGMNVEILRYSVSKMYDWFLNYTSIENTDKNKEKFIYVLRLHGFVDDDNFTILNNEFYEDYNLFYRLTENLAFAFDLATYQEVEDGELNERAENIFDMLITSSIRKGSNSVSDISTDGTYEIIEKIEQYKQEND